MSELEDDDFEEVDPADFEEEAPPPREADLRDKALSFLTGLGRGATFGFADELAGAVAAPFRSVSDGVSIPEAYRAERDENRAVNRQLTERAPGYAMAGDVGGSIASPLIFGKLAAAGRLGAGAVRAAQALEAAPITSAALQGGLRGVGESESASEAPAPAWLADVALEGLKGAAIGGGTAKGIQLVGKGVSAVSGLAQNAADSVADGIALRAAGGERSSLKAMAKSKGGERKLRTLAKFLLRGKGMDGEPMMSHGMSASDIAKRARDVKAASGKLIGDARAEVTSRGGVVDLEPAKREIAAYADDIATQAGTGGPGAKARVLEDVDLITQRLERPYPTPAPVNAIAAAQAAGRRPVDPALMMRATGYMPAEAARLGKGLAQRPVPVGGDVEEVSREATRMGKEIAQRKGFQREAPELSNMVERLKVERAALAKARDKTLAQKLTPEELKAYARVSKVFGRSSDIAELGSDKLAREFGNLPVGIMELQGAQGGQALAREGKTVTGVMLGGVGALATRLAKTRGGASVALLLDQIARAEMSDTAAAFLEEAARRGPNAVLAAYYELQKRGEVE